MTGSRSAPGYAVLVTLLAVTAVVGAALLAFEAPAPPDDGARFASAETSVLCHDLINPVATTDTGAPEIAVHVDVVCQDDLPSRVAVKAVRGGTATEVYRLTFSSDGSVTAETPYGQRSLSEARAGAMGIVTSSDESGYDWILADDTDLLDTSTDDLADGPFADEEHCTPEAAVLCVDAQEGVTVTLPGVPGDGEPGQEVTVEDLVTVVEGNVSEVEDGPVEDVRSGRFCQEGGSLVRDHAGTGPADAVESGCLLAVQVADGNATTLVGHAEDVHEDVDSVVFHEKTLTVTGDGETLAEVTIPNPEELPSEKPGVTVLGKGPCTHVTEQLTIAVAGDETGPCGGDIESANVTGTDGGTSASLERVGEGRYRVGTPAGSVAVDAAAVEVVSDPADADAETVLELVTAAGDTTVTLTVKEPAASLVPDETEVHVAHTVEDQTGVNLTKVVGDLLVVEDHDGDESPERVGAFPGRAVENASLHVEYDEGQWVVATPGGTAQLDGAEVTVAPDAADPGTVHVLLRDADGNTLARFTLDGDSTPPTLDYSVDQVGDGTVAPPVSVEPGPQDPESVSVFGPDGDLLLVYEESGSKATVKVPPAGESATVDRRTVRIDGNPVQDREWTLSAGGPQGDEVVRYTVNRPNYEKALREADRQAPADLGPVIGVVPDAPDTTEEVDFLDYVTDGESVHADESDLDGTRWMSGLRAITFDARFPDTTAYDRFYVRYTDREAVPLDAPTVALSPGGDGDANNRTGSVTLADRSPGWDGQVLRFEVVAERRVGDGLVAYARVDNRTDEPFGVRVDAKAPSASVSSPDAPDGTTWLVSWEGTDASSGVSSYTVQVNRSGAGWEHHAGPTTGRSVQFTGQADTSYAYRARATDVVGHAGPWSNPSSTEYVAPVDDGTDGTTGGDGGGIGNQAPGVELVSPDPGATLDGIVEVRWTADDPDGTAPAVNVYVSPDGGTSWTSLRTTSDRAYWDTTEWPNRPDYHVRAVVDDGSLTDEHVVQDVTVANAGVGAGPDAGGASPGGDGGATDGGTDGGTGDGAADGGDGAGGQGSGDGGGNGVPGPGALVSAAAGLGAAAVARRRRR